VASIDIFWFDVAVDDSLPVSGRQRFCALDGDGEEFVQGQRLAQTLAQVLALHKLQN
jgi:hypothetical protein